MSFKDEWLGGGWRRTWLVAVVVGSSLGQGQRLVADLAAGAT